MGLQAPFNPLSNKNLRADPPRGGSGGGNGPGDDLRGMRGPNNDGIVSPDTEVARLTGADLQKSVFQDFIARRQSPDRLEAEIAKSIAGTRSMREEEVLKYIADQGLGRQVGDRHLREAMAQFDNNMAQRLPPAELNRLRARLSESPAPESSKPYEAPVWSGWSPGFSRTWWTSIGTLAAFTAAGLVAGVLGHYAATPDPSYFQHAIAWIAPGLGLLGGIWAFDFFSGKGIKRAAQSYNENITHVIREVYEESQIDIGMMEKKLHLAARRYCQAVGGKKLVKHLDKLIADMDLFVKATTADDKAFGDKAESVNQLQWAAKVNNLIATIDNFALVRPLSIDQQPVLRRLLGRPATNYLNYKWRWHLRNDNRFSIKSHLTEVISYALQSTKWRGLSESMADEQAKEGMRRNVKSLISRDRLVERDDLDLASYQGALAKWKFTYLEHTRALIDFFDIDLKNGPLGGDKTWKGMLFQPGLVIGFNFLAMHLNNAPVDGSKWWFLATNAWEVTKFTFNVANFIPSTISSTLGNIFEAIGVSNWIAAISRGAGWLGGVAAEVLALNYFGRFLSRRRN